jgi:hypothetical protein
MGMCRPFAKPDESTYLITYTLTLTICHQDTVINTLLSLIFNIYASQNHQRVKTKLLIDRVHI